jgi:hypothetical protein
MTGARGARLTADMRGRVLILVIVAAAIAAAAACSDKRSLFLIPGKKDRQQTQAASGPHISVNPPSTV